MPKNNLIAICVPVYNVEKYVAECLDSILAQTFTNWICVLVDDCSTDSSKQICQEYLQKDSRFHLLEHAENKGLPRTRQTGVNYALEQNVDYIACVDSDDIIEPKYLEVLYQNLINNNADISRCHHYRFGDLYEIVKQKKEQIFVLNQKEDIVQATIKFYNNMSFALAFMLAKSQLFQNIDWNYNNVLYNEDARLAFQLNRQAEKIVLSTQKLYGYRSSSNSIMNSVDCTTPKQLEQIDLQIKTTDDYNAKNNLTKTEIDILNALPIRTLGTLAILYYQSQNNLDGNFAQKIIAIFKSRLDIIQANPYTKDLSRVKFVIEYYQGNLEQAKQYYIRERIGTILGTINALLQKSETDKNYIPDLIKTRNQLVTTFSLKDLQLVETKTKISFMILKCCGVGGYKMFRKVQRLITK
jgi:glycosyltransferase involved in cell wall biosynthesis